MSNFLRARSSQYSVCSLWWPKRAVPEIDPPHNRQLQAQKRLENPAMFSDSSNEKDSQKVNHVSHHVASSCQRFQRLVDGEAHDAHLVSTMCLELTALLRKGLVNSLLRFDLVGCRDLENYLLTGLMRQRLVATAGGPQLTWVCHVVGVRRRGDGQRVECEVHGNRHFAWAHYRGDGACVARELGTGDPGGVVVTDRGD